MGKERGFFLSQKFETLVKLQIHTSFSLGINIFTQFTIILPTIFWKKYGNVCARGGFFSQDKCRLSY